MESSKTPIAPFNIFTDARYHHLKVIGDEATLQFSIVGLGTLFKSLMYYLLKRNIGR